MHGAGTRPLAFPARLQPSSAVMLLTNKAEITEADRATMLTLQLRIFPKGVLPKTHGCVIPEKVETVIRRGQLFLSLLPGQVVIRSGSFQFCTLLTLTLVCSK